MLEIIAYVLIFTLSLFFLRKLYINITSTATAIPSPPGYPILAHFPTFARGQLLDVFRNWIQNYAKDGMIRINLLFTNELIVVTHNNDIKKVLITEAHKSKRPSVVTKSLPFRDAIFGSYGRQHAWQRKLLHPMFSSISVGRYDTLFERHSIELVKHWSEKIDASPENRASVKVERDLEALSLNIIGDAGFGFKFDSFNKKDWKVSKAFDDLLTGSFGPIQQIAKHFGFFGRYITGVTNREASLKIVLDTITEVVETKRTLNRNKGKDGSSKKIDLLEVMMGLQDEDSGKKMSEDLLVQNVLTFMVAGLDTSSTCLTWTLYLLALYPQIQERARDEVVKATSGDSSITRTSVDEMPFVLSILKESMRLYPPGPFVAREILQPITLGGVTVPPGYDVLVPFIYIQRSEEYWTRPDDFWPDRFLQTDEKEQPRDKGLQYFPFSYGPRSCIGNKFAMLEMRIILAVLLRNFKFLLPPDHPEVNMTLSLTLKASPTPELWVTRV